MAPNGLPTRMTDNRKQDKELIRSHSPTGQVCEELRTAAEGTTGHQQPGAGGAATFPVRRETGAYKAPGPSRAS